MDIFLLIVAIVMAIALVLINIYVLSIYIHPEDRGFGANLIPKILVVIGLTLSWGQVLIIPLDVSNTRGYGGGLNMDLFWEITIILTSLVLIFLIPFAYFICETSEEKAFKQRISVALTYTLFYSILFCAAFFISFIFLGQTDFPVQFQSLPASQLQDNGNFVNLDSLKANPPSTTASTVNFNVSLTVYAMAIFSFIGWIFLVFFGGMGLFAIPLDLIHSYTAKPIARKKDELLLKRDEMQKRIGQLIEMGQSIEESQKLAENANGFVNKRKAQGAFNKNVNKFQASVMSLEQVIFFGVVILDSQKEYDVFSGEVIFKSVKPVNYTTNLLLGIFFMTIAGLWWIHIFLSSIKDSAGLPMSLFLDSVLIWFDEILGVTFIGTGILMGLCIYLMFSVTKGNVKFGVQIPYLFTIHPMKRNETLMDSFLFNVWLILMSSVGVVQNIVATFPEYTRLTAADFFFGIQVRYMKFFRFFFDYDLFEYAFLVWSVLTLVILIIANKRKSSVKTQGNIKNEGVVL